MACAGFVETLKKEVEKRNNLNPTFDVDRGIPYLVDQHLLDK